MLWRYRDSGRLFGKTSEISSGGGGGAGKTKAKEAAHAKIEISITRRRRRLLGIAHICSVSTEMIFADGKAIVDWCYSNAHL